VASISATGRLSRSSTWTSVARQKASESSTLERRVSARPRASPLPWRSQYRATNGVSRLRWTRCSSSLRRLVLPRRRPPRIQMECRSPSRASRMRSARPKKSSPRTQLPAMKGFRGGWKAEPMAA
jgi:hypothetical protein